MFNLSSVLGFPQNVKNTYCMTAVTAKRKTRKDLLCFDGEVWQILLTTNNMVTINYIKKALASMRILMWWYCINLLVIIIKLHSFFRKNYKFFLAFWFVKKSHFELAIILIWYRSSRQEVFLGKGVLKICSKFTGEHQCQSAISIKLQSNFIEIAFRHACSPVYLLHILRTLFLRNTTGWLLLMILNKL